MGMRRHQLPRIPPPANVFLSLPPSARFTRIPRPPQPVLEAPPSVRSHPHQHRTPAQLFPPTISFSGSSPRLHFCTYSPSVPIAREPAPSLPPLVLAKPYFFFLLPLLRDSLRREFLVSRRSSLCTSNEERGHDIWVPTSALCEDSENPAPACDVADRVDITSP